MKTLFLFLPLLQNLANKTYNLEWDLLDLWDLERALLLGQDLKQDLLDLEDLLDLLYVGWDPLSLHYLL